MQTKKIKVIISGGGSGGHLFPALAIAKALQNLVKEIDILFVGAKGKMEMQIVPKYGYRIEGLWISGLQRKKIIKNLLFPLKLISSLIKSRYIISKFKPDLVIGTGGFASGPLLKNATAYKIPALIQEQNSFPGITNRLLAKKVQKICVAYDNMEKYFPVSKICFTGNPVRKEIAKSDINKYDALQSFNLNQDKKTILIIGGSLGAKTINESIKKFIDLFIKNNIQLIWQTGNYYYETAKKELQEFEIKEYKTRIYLSAFIDNMNYAYAASDLIISRAGAIAISELCLVGKPVILIPSPNVAEDHQTKNAKNLVDKKAALMIADKDAYEKLGSTVIDLVNNNKLMNELSKNIKKLGIIDSDEKIAYQAISLIKDYNALTFGITDNK